MPHINNLSSCKRDSESLPWRAFCLLTIIYIDILYKKSPLPHVSSPWHLVKSHLPCFLRGFWALPNPFIFSPALKLWKRNKVIQASDKTSYPLWYDMFLKRMPKPSCSRKRTMNHEEICTVEEKGELIAKLGQETDQRPGPYHLFTESAAPYHKMSYRGECNSARKTLRKRKVWQFYCLALQLLQLQAEKKDWTSLGDRSWQKMSHLPPHLSKEYFWDNVIHGTVAVHEWVITVVTVCSRTFCPTDAPNILTFFLRGKTLCLARIRQSTPNYSVLIIYKPFWGFAI